MATKYRINPITKKFEGYEAGTFFISRTFTNATARDAYFVTYPDQLLEYTLVQLTDPVPDEFWQYLSGTWTNVTPVLQGDTGATGAQGTAGATGATGSLWYDSAGVPSGTLGKISDYYLNSDNGNYYVKTGSSTWTLSGNILGPQGIPGTSFTILDTTPTAVDYTVLGTDGHILASSTCMVYVQASVLRSEALSITNVGTGTVSIIPYGLETINGKPSLELDFQWTSVILKPITGGYVIG